MTKMTKCNLCNTSVSSVFTKKILGKYKVKYYLCPSCNYLQTEHPYWLSESYSSAINLEDTGLVSRNLGLAKVTLAIITFFLDRNGKYLDYAGGYGLFTRLMRDIGLDFYTEDPYCENILARGYDSPKSVKKYELITLFEVFEHLEDPLSDLKKVFSRSDHILFTTQLMPSMRDLPSWDYLGVSHGQHVSLYSAHALGRIATKYGYHFYTDGSMIHYFSRSKISQPVFLLLIKFRVIIYPLLKLFYNSKTWSDHQTIKRL